LEGATATILDSLGIDFLGLARPVYGKKLGLSAVKIGGLVSLYSVESSYGKIFFAHERSADKVMLLKYIFRKAVLI
jgi:hypothetical protein